ncbi:MAG: peptidylprolyl isomerase [FCB group bacterium]|nr:peptidylprolyl isomerase [FCB group bacterium]
MLGLLLVSCSKPASDKKATQPESPREGAIISTEFGDITLEFFEDVAPKHVESFKILAKQGYFDGTTFHRVIPGFVIQGGDPNSRLADRTQHGEGGHAGKYFGLGDETNPDTWTIPAEFNDRPHVRGALSMARTPDPNSAGSQFFICVNDVNRLDHKYTVFGRVISGMDVVDRIVSVPRDERDNPRDPIPMTVKIVPLNRIKS